MIRKGARQTLTELKDIGPDHRWVPYHEARLLLAEGDQDAATQILTPFVSDFPDHAEAQFTLGKIAFMNENFQQAEAYLRSSLRSPLDGEEAEQMLEQIREQRN